MTKSAEKQMNLIAQNRKARYHYSILDTWEAGIKLIGVEVKALRQGNISLDESKLSDALQKGCTIVPLKIYFNNKGLAKLQIGTAKGKKLHDKRQTIRDRDLKRYGH